MFTVHFLGTCFYEHLLPENQTKPNPPTTKKNQNTHTQRRNRIDLLKRKTETSQVHILLISNAYSVRNNCTEFEGQALIFSMFELLAKFFSYLSTGPHNET